MKLLIIVASNERGGAEEYALKIASGATREWEVHVALPGGGGTESLARDFAAKGAVVHPLKIPQRHFRRVKLETGWNNAPPAPSLVLRFLQFAGRNYRRLLDAGAVVLQFFVILFLLLQQRPDVVLLDLPWPTIGLGAILGCGFLKIPTAVVFQLYPFPFSFRRPKIKAANWARSRCQQWVAVSENNKDLISGTFGIPRDEILRIYNGVDLASAEPATHRGGAVEERARVRRELGVPENAGLLLSVGRLEPQKGYDDLIQVIPHIVREFPNVWFVWLGNDERRGFYELKLRENGVSDRVRILGYRRDVLRFMKTADLLVSPSRFEGFPFAVLEAMALGLPVVTTGSGGVPEILQSDLHGLVTRAGDSCDLLEALRRALRSPQRMRAMARAARRRVRDFSEERMVRETLELLERLGGPSKPQGVP